MPFAPFALVTGVATLALFASGVRAFLEPARFGTLAASARRSAARLIAAMTAADSSRAVLFGRSVMPACFARASNVAAPPGLSPAARSITYVSSHPASVVLAAANSCAVTLPARGMFPLAVLASPSPGLYLQTPATRDKGPARFAKSCQRNTNKELFVVPPVEP